MPEEPLRIAQFDHVSDGGDLVFVFDHRHFAVRVDDALERGILEAKQIRAEEEGFPSPQSASALPISRIQSYIRAGADPEAVARQFNIAQALVRRFSAPVETEKKYAIDQFLTVAVPPNSKAKSYGDLIDMTLRNARIAMSSITWSATRRGHEPWRIRAQFQSAGRIVTADWNWNIRDNTVSPINRQARRLIGVPDNDEANATSSLEQVLDGRGPLPFAWMENNDEDASQNLPRQNADRSVNSQSVATSKDSRESSASLSDSDTRTDAARDASSERAGNRPSIDFLSHHPQIADVSSRLAYVEGKEAQDGDDVSAASSPHQNTPSDEHEPDDHEPDEHERRHGNKYSSWMYKTAHGRAHATAPHVTRDEPSVQTAAQQHTDTHTDTSDKHVKSDKLTNSENPLRSNAVAQESHGAGESARRQPPQSPAQTSQQAARNTDKTAAASKDSTKNQDSSKKRSGRSAVPSWDEILFGD
ncbi:septation protein SepH [Bifidobacterium aquikefiricola]|uniref:Septation protein SepH n=1 Tax=Bifidobacterium aquikefiricola TaxID=3059038 RepID=A0AB39U4I8_9BIFI